MITKKKLLLLLLACSCARSEPPSQSPPTRQVQALLRAGATVPMDVATQACEGRTAVSEVLEETGPWVCAGQPITLLPDSTAQLRSIVSRQVMDAMSSASLCPAGTLLTYRITNSLVRQLSAGERHVRDSASLVDGTGSPEEQAQDQAYLADQVRLVDQERTACQPRPDPSSAETPEERRARLAACAEKHVKYDTANFTNFISMTSDPAALFATGNRVVPETVANARFLMVVCVDPAGIVDVNELLGAEIRTWDQHELQYALADDEIVDRSTFSDVGKGVEPVRTYILPTLDPPCAARDQSHIQVAVTEPGAALELPWTSVRRGARIVAASSSSELATARLVLQWEQKAGDEPQTQAEAPAATALEFVNTRSEGRYRVLVRNGSAATQTLRARMEVLRGDCGGLPDLCYGAIGAQCDTGLLIPQGNILNWQPSCRAQADGTLVCATAVGSQAHDSCCSMAVNRNEDGTFRRSGQWCAGPVSAADFSACTDAWSHAVNDTTAQRRWDVTYDPIAFGYTGSVELATLAAPGQFNPTMHSMLAPDDTRIWITDAGRSWCANPRFRREGEDAICGRGDDDEEPCVELLDCQTPSPTPAPPSPSLPPSPSPSPSPGGADPRGQGSCANPGAKFCGTDGRQYACGESGGWISTACSGGLVCEAGECRCPSGTFNVLGTCTTCAPPQPGCPPGYALSPEGECVTRKACVDVASHFEPGSSFQVLNVGWKPYEDYERQEMLPGEWSALPAFLSQAESVACCQSNWLTGQYVWNCTRKISATGDVPKPFSLPGVVYGFGSNGWPQALPYTSALPGHYYEDQIGAECTAFAGRTYEQHITAKGPIYWCAGERTAPAVCPANMVACRGTCVESPTCCP